MADSNPTGERAVEEFSSAGPGGAGAAISLKNPLKVALSPFPSP
jgi:hypothetical protein